MSSQSPTLNRSFAALRQFAQRRESSAASEERCELCGVPLAPEHAHLIEPESRQIVCSCQACALLFPNRPELKYRRVSRDVRALPEFRLTDAQWNGLSIPVNMAFFFFSSPANRVVAFYPSPAGATESLLELDAWNDVVRDNPVLESMAPDVEALLVNRLSPGRGQPAREQTDHEYYLAPIDKCFQLVGLIRTNWRGFSGGTEVWQEIAAFFENLKATT